MRALSLVSLAIGSIHGLAFQALAQEAVSEEPPSETPPSEETETESEPESTEPQREAEPDSEAERDGEPEPAPETDVAPPEPERSVPPPALDLDESDIEALFEGDVEGATADVAAPPTEATRRELSEEQLTTLPGTRGDALRAIEVLPGVGRVPFGASDGAPRLRGSPSDDSRVLLDGVPVPILYHFGGLTSFFNSHLLESVDLYPGNYSSRYGRATAGIVDAHVKKAHPDALRAKLELSLIDNFALVDAPLGPDTSLALAGRRSNIDFVFDQLVPEGTFNVVAAPVYYDYQAILRQRLGDEHQLRVVGYGSHDRIRLVFDDPNAEDPALRDEVGGSITFHRLQLHLESQLGERARQHLILAVGPELLEQRFGDWRARFEGKDLYANANWSFLVHDTLRVDAGLDLESQFFRGYYSGPAPADPESDPSIGDPAASLSIVNVSERSLTLVRPGAFVELSFRPIESLLLIPGVRADYQKETAAWSVDPRVALRHQTTDELVLKTAFGLYTQPVIYYLLIPEIGNPNVDPERVAQTSAGFELTPSRSFHLDVDTFYKHWVRRISTTPGGAPPRFENSGDGRAYGLETLVRAAPLPRVQTLAAYTLSRSERRDAGGPWRTFMQDQTHILSLVASYEIGGGFTLGARFRYVTGDPETPVVGAVYAAELDQYRPVYGPLASQRRRAFHQLDLRADKRWELGPVLLTAYLEVLNAYNAKNVEGTSYSFDFSRSEPVTGLPFFPNFGIRGEL